MEIGSFNQQEDIIDPGLTHVKIYKTNNEKKKKSKCDNLNNVYGLQTQATDHKKDSIRVVDEGELPPYVIVVHGPPKVGKSLLIKCLVKYYTSYRSHVTDVILLDNGRRIQFVECPNNVNGMIDAAKYADAVIFLIDTRYGFEMETFEFLNILKVHGIMEVMGVLTYLDGIGSDEILTQTKHSLMDHFHSEICEAAEVFCLPFLDDEMYSMLEISQLASFISSMNFHRLSWRTTQPYILVKHFEDVTAQDMQKDVKCSRNIVLEGYLRGCNIKKGTKVHIAGVGDFPLAGIESLSDPFPLPDAHEERFEIEDLRTGTYLRLEVRGVPSEMVENLCGPILVGFIGIEEEEARYMQVKLMRHGWHRKLLKSRDPIIVSIGWRRYQTKPVYGKEYCHGWLQMLECTPKNKQCIAMFWGPLAPPNTGVVVVQNMASHEAAFRILATGIVHGNNQAVKVFKKRTLIRTSSKIFKKTSQAKSGHGRKIKKAGDTALDGLRMGKYKHTIHVDNLTFTRVRKEVKVPRVFHPFMAALKPRDRIWRHFGPADKGLSELPESVNKLLEDMRDKDAPELKKSRRERILKRLEKENADVVRNYGGVGWRQTLEQQRAVIIVEGEPSARTSSLSEDKNTGGFDASVDDGLDDEDEVSQNSSFVYICTP